MLSIDSKKVFLVKNHLSIILLFQVKEICTAGINLYAADLCVAINYAIVIAITISHAEQMHVICLIGCLMML